MTELANERGAELAAAAARDGATITVTLTGSADNAGIAMIERVLDAVHAAATDGVTEVVVDLRKLDFMNSSCFKSFVTWISDVQERPPERQYRIRLLSDPGLHWQKRSLHALRCFAIELITVET